MSDKDRTTISREARIMMIICEDCGAKKVPDGAVLVDNCKGDCFFMAKGTFGKILAMLDERHKALYQAINKLMIKLAADGEVDTRDIEVENVMNALHDIDGGAATKEEG